MPIEGFSKYHICKNGRLYSIHSGTWRLIKPVAKSTGYNLRIPRKDILEEFQISTKLLYMILRKYNVKLRKL
jgi:hypothetical protein